MWIEKNDQRLAKNKDIIMEAKKKQHKIIIIHFQEMVSPLIARALPLISIQYFFGVLFYCRFVSNFYMVLRFPHSLDYNIDVIRWFGTFFAIFEESHRLLRRRDQMRFLSSLITLMKRIKLTHKELSKSCTTPSLLYRLWVSEISTRSTLTND